MRSDESLPTRPGSSHPQCPRRMRLLPVLLAAVFVFGAAPSGAQAYKQPELTCATSWDLLQALLKRHISYRGLDTEIRERAIDAYLEKIDPSKTLYLSSEITSLRRRMAGVFFALQNGECDLLDEIE